MQRNTKNTKVAVLILLVLVAALTVVLASCDPGTGNPGIDDSIATISRGGAESSETSSEQVVSTAPGFTEVPVIKDIKNITADEVVIAGTCQEGATVTIGGGKEDVTVQSKNGYFIAQVKLTNTTSTLLEASAAVEGLEPSVVYSFTADYVATAEKRMDGNGVSVGSSSQLFFDTYLDDYTGKNLFTQTELDDFKTNVNNKISGLENKATGQELEFIFVLVPDSTTVNPEIFPADTEQKTFKTRYTQISETLSKTNATFIDMYAILKEAKDAGEYAVYRNTDSHLTEYGAYLVYQQIANAMAVNFPDAKARTLDEFTQETVTSVGGDLMTYLGITNSNYTETLVDFTPKFDLKMGKSESDKTSVNISDIQKYLSDKDYSIYNETDEKVVGVNERYIVRTERENLPCALVYRDDSAAPAMDLIAERFNTAMFGKSGDFDINYTDASRYKNPSQKVVDYVVVIVSEKNVNKMMDNLNVE